MKSLMKKVDLFCYQHPNFGIPNLMLYVVIGNAIVWLFTMAASFSGSGAGILEYLYFSPYHILRGQIWRLVTFIIIPSSTSILALIFFYFYYMIGRTVEAQWGAGKFTIYFFSGVLLTVVYGFLLYFLFHVNLAISAEQVASESQGVDDSVLSQIKADMGKVKEPSRLSDERNSAPVLVLSGAFADKENAAGVSAASPNHDIVSRVAKTAGPAFLRIGFKFFPVHNKLR